MNNSPEIDYLPLDLPGPTGGPGELVSENIARIELLKMKVLEWPGVDDLEKETILRELDILRGSIIQASSLPHQAMADLGADVLAPPLANAEPDDLKIEGIIGQNRQINKILKIIAKVAPTDLTILLEGETGSGKELFARIVHLNSKREKFVAVNCGAFPADIIESELFGHAKGAFTGANSDRKGKFEEADGGTIFLDEIGDLELQAQVKLLRVLEVGELQRVGSDKVITVEAKVIAATNKNLEEMVETGEFREDLFFRINMCPLWIPPLRERRDEIEILFEFFSKQAAARINKKPAVLNKELHKFIFHSYDYPGNIRELRNLAHYIAYIADKKPVKLDDLPERYKRYHANGGRTSPDTLSEDGKQIAHVRKDAEKEYMVEILERFHGNIKKICTETQLSRSRIYQLLNKFELKASDYR